MSTIIIALVQLVHTVINIYIWIVIISALFSFVRPDPYNPLVKFIYGVTEPAFRWIRRKAPFVVISQMDLSPLVLLLGLQFIDTILIRSIY
jgi:YggT family protein